MHVCTHLYGAHSGVGRQISNRQVVGPRDVSRGTELFVHEVHDAEHLVLGILGNVLAVQNRILRGENISCPVFSKS